MGELRFSGLASGIDTSSLVEQLMTVESRRLATYKVDKSKFQQQATALDELRTQINALKTSTSALSNIDDMQIFTATSSDRDILNVSATSDAGAGSHTVDVDQLATSETWIQDTSTFSYKTDYVGGGDFIYTYNHQQRVITAVENETTLQDFVNLINSDEDNPGVTASLLYQGGKYHLMLSGQETGEDYQISIDQYSREIWKPDTDQPNSTFTSNDNNATLSTKILDLEQFSGTLGTSDKVIISGKNHAGSNLPDTEITITEETTLAHLIDAINEHYDGTATARLQDGQIWLTDNTTGASGLEMSLTYSGDATLELPTMAVATEGDSTAESLDSFLSTSFIETQNASNSKVKIDGYPSQSVNEIQTLTITGGIPTTGTFKLTFNGQTTDAIAYDASAEDIQTALTALSGVEAGDILVTGSDLPTGDISIEFAGNFAGMDVAKLTVSDDSSMDAGIVSVDETAKGNDGWIHRNSNGISDAIEGVTLNLHDITETDNPVKITITRNTAAISKNIQSMVTAYNELLGQLKDKTEYNADTKEIGILSRDMAATFLKTQMRSPFTSIAKGFVESLDDFVQADDIGITVNGAGELEFDSAVFDSAISDNYKGVLEVLGAAKSGSSSDSTHVQFYSSSEKYTTAGVYHVKVEVDENNEIVSAKIKLSTESEYRDAESWDGNIISFSSEFDDNGNPVNPEHSLQVRVELQEGTYGTDENPVVIRVKQGIFGALEDTLTDLLKTDGSFDASEEALETKTSRMDDKIEKEEARLKIVEQHLNEKFARLEKTLTMMQKQQSTVTAMLGSGSS